MQEMRQRRDTSIFSLAKILYTLGRVQHNCLANQVTVRPCSWSVRLICRPMWSMRPPPSVPGLPTGCFHGFLRNRYIRKRRGNLTFARSEIQGLRMPTCRERTTQKAHADMLYDMSFPRKRKKRHVDIHTTRTPLVAICSSDRSKVAKF